MKVILSLLNYSKFSYSVSFSIKRKYQRVATFTIEKKHPLTGKEKMT